MKRLRRVQHRLATEPSGEYAEQRGRGRNPGTAWAFSKVLSAIAGTLVFSREAPDIL
jgi:hypothetical protein